MLNAKLVKERLAELKLTQTEAAKIMNLSQPALSQKISGARIMSLPEAEKLCKILKIPETQFGSYFFMDEIA